VKQKQVIRSALVPETSAPFSNAVVYDGMIYISGLPPFDAAFAQRIRDARAKGERPPVMDELPFEQQVRIVMDHMKALVEAAGSSMDNLLKVTVWLKDQANSEIFDHIYRGYFSGPDALPARTRMQAGRTPLECGLEVDAIGFVP